MRVFPREGLLQGAHLDERPAAATIEREALRGRRQGRGMGWMCMVYLLFTGRVRLRRPSREARYRGAHGKQTNQADGGAGARVYEARTGRAPVGRAPRLPQQGAAEFSSLFSGSSPPSSTRSTW